MVNIQSPTAEIRQGKKKEEEERRKKLQDEKIYMVSLLHRATINKPKYTSILYRVEHLKLLDYKLISN